MSVALLIFFFQAKGYPDISTRHFLHSIAESTNQAGQPRHIPMYALMDFDPDGVAIMSTYKHGSIALHHENASLQIPQLEWLGIKSIDIDVRSPVSPFRVCTMQDPVESENSDPVNAEAVLRLTRRDRRKANSMLEKTEGREGAECMRELQIMLMLNVKVEIQILSSRPGGLESWLEWRLSEALQT